MHVSIMCIHDIHIPDACFQDAYSSYILMHVSMMCACNHDACIHDACIMMLVSMMHVSMIHASKMCVSMMHVTMMAIHDACIFP